MKVARAERAADSTLTSFGPTARDAVKPSLPLLP